MNDINITLLKILSSAWRRRKMIIIPVLMFPVAGFFAGLMSDQKYQTHTSMLIQETAKLNPFLEDFAVSASLKERITTLSTLLHSRHILAKVAEQRSLIKNDSDASFKEEVIAKLSNSLSVSMPGKDLIRIDFKAGDPFGMKETLEVVSQQFIAQLLAPERSSMAGSAVFLKEQLERRREDIESAEIKLGNFKDKYSEELPEFHSSNVSRLAQLKQLLAEKEAELAGAQKSLGSLDAQLSKTNPVVGRLEEQIIRFSGDLALLRSRYTDSHSKVQSVIRKLNSLESERQQVLANNSQQLDTDQLWQIASNLGGNAEEKKPLLVSQLESLQLSRTRTDGLQEEITRLVQLIKDLELKSSSYGALEGQLTKLVRDLKVKRELYDEILNRYEMARITSSLSRFEQDKRVKIIDQPFTPNFASNLPIVVYIIAGFIAGVLLGIGLAVIAEIFDMTIRYKDRLSEVSGVPVIGSIDNI